MATESEWYWDLAKDIAVRAEERGPGDRVMGPYPTRGEAENWKSKVEARNEAWDDADEEWEHAGRDDDGRDPGSGAA